MTSITNEQFSACLILCSLPRIQAPTLLLSPVCNTCPLLRVTGWLCSSDYREAIRMDDVTQKRWAGREENKEQSNIWGGRAKAPTLPSWTTLILLNGIFFSFDGWYFLAFWVSSLSPSQTVCRYWTLLISSVLGFLWHSRRWRMTLLVFFPLEHRCFHWGFKQTMLMTWYLPGYTQHLYLQRSSWAPKNNVKITQHGPWGDLRPGLSVSFTLVTYTSAPIYFCRVWFGPSFS